ncbi:MAG TPA: CocE/NonD family hydrolase [Pyrinomonadaceae bacterium]|nr:CocE/NonD family hydrolase [Pyrinomonadaceae bacterium]
MTKRILLALLLLSLITAVPIAAQQPAAQATPVEVKIDPSRFDPYVGQYEDAVNLGGTIFSFFREGDKYFFQITNQDRFDIVPSSESTFFEKRERGGTAEFTRDAQGRVVGMVWRQGGAEFRTKKIADQPAKDARVAFKKTEVMIPMRDGVKLFTVILEPEHTEALPIIMSRTPYGVKGVSSNGVNGSRSELVKDGYIFVYQDIRGRTDSEGVFEMLHPPRDKSNPKSTDESTDTYDTIEYLIKNVANNNGKVGIMGVSYDGWTAAVALLDPHPALKASSPQAPVTDLWMGDDFSHNGAFRQTYAHHWAVPLEMAAKGGSIKLDHPDLYDWYLKESKLPDLANEMSKLSHSWKAFIEHPTWDSYWQARAANLYIKDTSVPTLVVGGWWDQEDLYGPLALYRALEKTDNDNQVNLVMGPWNHGGWGGRGRRLGTVDFGSDTGRYYRSEIQAPWFAHYLHGKPMPKIAEANIFRSGSNQWMKYDSWTPNGTFQKRALYFNADGKLSFEKPVAKGEAFDSYVSNPADPVPYRKRPILKTYTQGSTWSIWLSDDQRFLNDRKDVLSWKTDVLADDVTITGDIIASLFASTSGSDSDWVVKLIDVYPADYAADTKMANYELMVASEVFRGRFLKSYEKAEALTPNKVTEYSIDMRGNDYTFKKGHRIMVQVQSSWFPLYNRNPQKFVPNIVMASDSDYQSATQKVYRSAKFPSHINVSVAR